MMAGANLAGPVSRFISSDRLLNPTESTSPGDADEKNVVQARSASHVDLRNVARADPFQGQAVELARTEPALVVHGPPGTGKSQTITNIISDHLSRGERTLFVCDKRTALDVVINRLEHLGLGGLCALVHDPQRDQRDLYMSIRSSLEMLPEQSTRDRAQAELDRVDAELDEIHAELRGLHQALMQSPAEGGAGSVSSLVGRWLAVEVDAELVLEAEAFEEASLAELEAARGTIEVALERGRGVGWSESPWVKAAGGTLENLLSRDPVSIEREVAGLVQRGEAADATAAATIPPFDAERPLAEQKAQREELRGLLEALEEPTDDAAGAALDQVGQRVGGMRKEEAERLAGDVAAAGEATAAFRSGPVDAELWLTVRDDPPTMRAIAEQLAVLEAYIDASRRWYGFLLVGKKSAAAKVLKPYGLRRTPADAARLASVPAGAADADRARGAPPQAPRRHVRDQPADPGG